MKFFKGKVDLTLDSKKQGSFKVNINGRPPDSHITVNYVSPFYDAHNGGMFAVPAHGSEVFMMYDESLGEYFYMGTIVGKSRFDPGIDDSLENEVINERLAYNSDGTPCMMTLTNSDGAGLKIINHLDGKDKPVGKSVVLKTALGHFLELRDDPSKDQLALKTHNQDGITITGEATKTYDARLVNIHTNGAIRETSVEGEIRLDLIDGRDITIRNNSSGMKGGLEIDTPLGPINPIPAGNLNLVTKYKDINIYTEELPNVISGKPGRILLSTPQGLIQIKSGSDGVTIYSEGKINIASVKTIKQIALDTLGKDAQTGLPNITGELEPWLVTVGQSVDSGQLIGSVSVGITTKQSIPIISPYKGTITALLFQQGNTVSRYIPLIILETDGGTINMQSTGDINIEAGGNLNLKSGTNPLNLLDGTTKIDSKLDVTVNSLTSVKLNSLIETKVQSTGQVGVAGPYFSMGAAISNIVPANGGGTVYSPEVTLPEPVIPPLPSLPITTELGLYSFGKQPK